MSDEFSRMVMAEIEKQFKDSFIKSSRKIEDY
jgi:hypothetical protein